MIGVTTDIQHGLTADDVRRCGFGLARIVLRWSEDPSGFMRSCYARGIKVVGVWTWEALAPDADNGASAAMWAQWLTEQELWPTLTYTQIDNEPDLRTDGKAELNAMVAEVAPHFREHTTIVGGGLASGDARWLDGVDLSLIDLVAVHPYGRKPNNAWKWHDILPDWSTGVEDFLIPYLRYQKPLCVTEYGEKEGMLGDLWRDYYTEMTCTMRRLISDGTLSFASLYAHSALMASSEGTHDMGMLDAEGLFTAAGRGVRSVIS